MLGSLPVEFRPRAGAVDFQCAGRAHGVGATENPVLPGGKAAENARLHAFRAGRIAGSPSSPVKASGESAARLSMASRSSSAQSSSSGAKVTRPSSSASRGYNRSPMRLRKSRSVRIP